MGPECMLLRVAPLLFYSLLAFVVCWHFRATVPGHRGFDVANPVPSSMFRIQCASSFGENLAELSGPADVSSLAECKALCSEVWNCSAMAWYTQAWRSRHCHLVHSMRPVARRTHAVRRARGAACYAKDDLRYFQKSVSELAARGRELEASREIRSEEAASVTGMLRAVRDELTASLDPHVQDLPDPELTAAASEPDLHSALPVNNALRPCKSGNALTWVWSLLRSDSLVAPNSPCVLVHESSHSQQFRSRRLTEASASTALKQRIVHLKKKVDTIEAKIDQLHARLVRAQDNEPQKPRVMARRTEKKEGSYSHNPSWPVLEATEPWTWQVWAAFGIFVTICIGGQGICCMWCTFLSPRAFSANIKSGVCAYVRVPNTSMNEMEVMGRLLQREMKLKLLTPIILPLLMSYWTTCHSGTPWWAYLLFVPLCVRAAFVEWWILQRVTSDGWRHLLSRGFAIGVLDHLDWFVDSFFPIQACWCDATATPYFVESLQQSWIWPVAPVVAQCRFWGVTLLSLSAAALTQQALGSMGSGVGSLVAAADVACFGAVAQHYESLEPSEEKGLGKVFTTFSKVLIKDAFQAWLQASFLGLTFTTLTPHGMLKLLLSVALSLLCIVSKMWMATTVSCQQLFLAWNYGRKDLALMVAIILTLHLMTYLLVLWTIAKLCGSVACPSHLWNLTAGCVTRLSDETAF